MTLCLLVVCMYWHQFFDKRNRKNTLIHHCLRYPVDEAFLSNVRTEILYQVQRLQSHPSIVLWAGNNENEIAVANIGRLLPPDQQEALKNDYRKLYIDTIMKAVVEVDPRGSRPFVPSSPSNGIESIRENYTAKNPEDPLYGMSDYVNVRLC